MRLWNLTEFSEVQDQVVLSFAASVKRPASRHRKKKHPVRVSVAVCAAAFVGTLTFFTVHANSNRVAVSPAGIAIAQSVPVEKPPFDSLFGNRFDHQWTKALEDELLGTANQQLCAQPDELSGRVIDSVFSNQQEDLSQNVNRLDRDTIARISRGRKKA